MRKQFFGFNQKVWTDEEWFDIATQMKNSPRTRLRYIRMINEAEHQGSRFNRIGFVSGIVFFLAFMKFPVIRVQPGFRRLGLSLGLSSAIGTYVSSIGTQMQIKRIKTAYRKQLVAQQCAHRITI